MFLSQILLVGLLAISFELTKRMHGSSLHSFFFKVANPRNSKPIVSNREFFFTLSIMQTPVGGSITLDLQEKRPSKRLPFIRFFFLPSFFLRRSI